MENQKYKIIKGIIIKYDGLRYDIETDDGVETVGQGWFENEPKIGDYVEIKMWDE